MTNRQEFRFPALLLWILVVVFSTVVTTPNMAAQSESVDSAKKSSYDSFFERRLAQILPHPAKNAPAAKPAQSLPARSDRASRTFPGQAHQAPGQDLARPLGASVAAERYVFGRMDLATDPTPLAVAIGAFQTG